MLEFGSRLDVKEQYALAQACHKLVFGLAYACENDLFRVEPSLHHPIQLAARDDVRPRSEGSQSPQYRQIPVCLHGVADQVIQA
jgi:hypothetical protein